MCPKTSQEQQKLANGKEASDDHVADWREEVINGGSLRHVGLDGGSNGWASPPGELFNLRAKGYLTGKKVKVPSGEWLLKPAGVDWLKSNGKLEHVLAREDNRVMAAFKRARARKETGAEFLLAVNLQVPGRPDAYSAVFYWAAEEPIPPESLLGRFINGDDAYRNSRFKMVNRIVKGPWIVRATVGNYAACILGRALPCRYYKGDDYLEIDVDISTSAIASAILHLALGAVTSITIDMGFLVEGQSEEELPERLWGAVRIAQMEMGSAMFVECGEEVVPEAVTPSKAGFRVGSARVANSSSLKKNRAGGVKTVGRSGSSKDGEDGGT